MGLDLNSTDVPANNVDPLVHSSIERSERLNALTNLIKQQYVDLESLGEDLTTTFSEEFSDSLISSNIYLDMVEYVNKHYITIGDIDNLDGEDNRLIIAGEYIYQFICVDNVTAILPAFLETLSVNDIDEFDRIVNSRYLNNIGKLRKDYLNVIQTTISQLLKLQTLDDSVKSDKKYQKLLAKYYYYQELVDYGDCQMFLTNYLRPVVNKYFSTLLWRMI